MSAIPLEPAEVHLRIGVSSRRDPIHDVRQIRALIAIRKSFVSSMAACSSSTGAAVMSDVMKGNRLFRWTRGSAGDSSGILMAKDSSLK